MADCLSTASDLPPPPLPAPDARWALFLDVDGTLTDIRPRPDDVTIAEATRAILTRIAHATQGAVALVSGRTIGDIDRLFAPLHLATAGLHGLERRTADGHLSAAPDDPEALQPIRDALGKFVAAHPGTILEDKGAAIALHFRGAPEAEAEAEPLIAGLLARNGDGVVLQRGKMVREIRAAGINKGGAIRTFMEEAPFCDRTPVFVGDDVTDEDGFATINDMHGISIKVGNDRKTAATSACPDVGAIHQWLAAVADILAPPATPSHAGETKT